MVNGLACIISQGRDLFRHQDLQKHDKKDLIKRKIIHVQVTLIKFNIFEKFIEERLKNAEICLESFLDLEWDKIVKGALVKESPSKGDMDKSSMFKKKSGNNVIKSAEPGKRNSAKKEVLNDFSVILQPVRLVFKIIVKILSNKKDVINS